MATPLLVPMSVAAKVVTSPINVPTLYDTPPTLVGTPPVLKATPFATGAVLEKGIHVHSAPPDALTSTRVLNGVVNAGDPGPNPATNHLIFPGVPDLWLVVRFNPVKAAVARTWVAWVVDSRQQVVTPLGQWQPPNVPNGSTVHTVAGMLKPATGLGFTGWGVYDQSQPFDMATAAYYPNAASGSASTTRSRTSPPRRATAST